jgi:hypothetical protein|tara:strand:- start:222 stop:446 length:225 start_codon:yes stop_codon:yes gene_type:complete
MDIRKISVGSDYKSGSMHYIVGQPVLGGKYRIHLIQSKHETQSYLLWVEKNKEIFVWKEFLYTLPITLEYNINF